MVSEKKINIAIQEIKNKCPICKNGTYVKCAKCLKWENYIQIMHNAEIPVDYWFRNLKNFYGDERLKKYILEYTQDIDNNYKNGFSLFLVSERGRGKTMVSCSILKKAILNNYSVFYITLSDLISRMISDLSSFKIHVKRVDFLCIDEIDNRFIISQNSLELYGSQLENILRSRMQNKLPTIMCSNNVDINLIFNGQFGESFTSLWSQFVKVIPISGNDARKNKEKFNG